MNHSKQIIFYILFFNQLLYFSNLAQTLEEQNNAVGLSIGLTSYAVNDQLTSPLNYSGTYVPFGFSYFYITVVGDTTSGHFANNIYRELMNGWVYRISIQKVLSAEKISYEGIGLAPDIYVPALPLAPESDKDIVLDYAIKLFE